MEIRDLSVCRTAQDFQQTEPHFRHSEPHRRKKSGEVLEKNAGEWIGRVEISNEKNPGSKRSMYVGGEEEAGCRS